MSTPAFRNYASRRVPRPINAAAARMMSAQDRYAQYAWLEMLPDPVGTRNSYVLALLGQQFGFGRYNAQRHASWWQYVLTCVGPYPPKDRYAGLVYLTPYLRTFWRP